MSDTFDSQNDSTDEKEDVGDFWETSKNARLERQNHSTSRTHSHDQIDYKIAQRGDIGDQEFIGWQAQR